MTEGSSAEDVDEHIDDHQEAEVEEESTLRPHQAQNLKYLYSTGLQPPQPVQPVQLEQPPPSPDAQRQSQRQSQQSSKASPYRETFYMEEDEETDDEEAGEEHGHKHKVNEPNDAQYDSYEEFDDAPETPRQPSSRPITMIHSPLQPNAKRDEPPMPGLIPHNHQQHQQQMDSPTIVEPEAAAAAAGRSSSGGTDVMDFAAIEAAEMDDMVSPLTPVERAMLYKQQGMGARHHRSSGGGGGRMAGHNNGNNISPLTPGYGVSQSQAQAADPGLMGGFHAM
jgi:hypothetical protein